MRIRGRVLVSSCTVLLAGALLAGCADSRDTADKPTKPPSPTPTPVFTSDADALAAATEVYKQYMKASDDVGHDGGENPERVKPYVNAEGLQHEIESAQKIKDQDARGYGYSKLNNAILQSHVEKAGVATVRMYVCEDISDVDLRDASGKSLVDSSRSDYIAYVTELTSSDAGQLIIQSSKYWSGGGICKF
jgi:hypothetical protein